MAMEDCFGQGVLSFEDNEGSFCKQKSVVSAATTLDGPNGCFECNICLDNAHDPIVTLCGHLYCWPCIYKWLHFQGASITSEEQQQLCPVCKAGISETTLVPLYGRGHSEEPKDKESLQGLKIPSRPQAHGAHTMITTATPRRNPFRAQLESISPRHGQYSNSFPTPSSPSLIPTVLHPMIGMFGEMIPARVFGNTQAANLFAYHHVSYSPRVRRQELQSEKSLNRISIFLFCCFVLCLLLF